ncbi:hypothetical protein BDU57DRAFT_512077 [Ampelomyces quisqualis]|uniref:Uncharacterized protein n=1 Tax=Ampelomyces quisqualis TaxID=50730 RepID=A0A6A5QUU9_AMPQU|nr:hypothetical protein BDU57DRAFT_512077 [Ampelomyces quisqualis]
MSTHFYPRPLPSPSSPVRPSTAHSTIRAVTPSPPHSVPRPKSEHALGSTELATFARYVVQAEDGESGNPPGNIENGGGLRRRGRMTRSRSPEKSRSTCPQKLRTTSPRKTQIPEPVDVAPIGPQHTTPSYRIDEDYDQEPPLTPTPMTREQKRHAYTPLSAHDQPPPRGPITNTPSPRGPASNNPAAAQAPARAINNATGTNRSKQDCVSAAVSARSAPRFSPSCLDAPKRVSTSLSASSALSKYSVFSTPGRDELERKKALVEDDEGPFGRMKSVGDLVGERERVRSAGRTSEAGGKENGARMRMKMRLRGCGVGCVVM